MAAIDKIYLYLQDVPRFYEFLRSVDVDYRAVFPHAGSILDYTYLGTYTPEEIEEYVRDLKSNPDVTQIPVSNFSEIVDKFLYQHPRTPGFIKEYLLNHQYFSEGSLLEPLDPVNPHEYSGRFRVVSTRPCEGKMFNTALSRWECEVHGPDGNFLQYYPALRRTGRAFVPAECAGTVHHGLDYDWGSVYGPFKSVKAVYRFIRNTKLPVGSRVRVYDFRYEISELELLIIPEKHDRT